ncbi:MAG: epoxide hydrolase [Mycobacterium sp.]|jgi:pimeloyl-ACP methyl ester carboxylesterase|nr:epoxide hydrolase [Mycobacterium sp.]
MSPRHFTRVFTDEVGEAPGAYVERARTEAARRQLEETDDTVTVIAARCGCPDLRGAGWSSAPMDRYLKNDMADDLAAVLDRLGVGPVRLVAHDWGGPVAFIMMLRYPQKVTGFFGVNTIAPWGTLDLAMVRHLWRFWYQIPMSLPVIGPRVVGDPKGRYLRMLLRWVGAGSHRPRTTSGSTCTGWGNRVTRSPVRAGIAPSTTARHCAGLCAVNSTTRVSMSRCAGCSGRATRSLPQRFCEGSISGSATSNSRPLTALATGSLTSGSIWCWTGSAHFLPGT